MEARILGPLELAAGDRLVALGGPKQRALLAVLLLHLNEVVTTERLIEELWGDAAPTTAVKSVQIYVSSLRKALRAAGADDTALATQRRGYAFRLESSALDACSFERALAEAIKTLADGEAARAAATLREALSLWRGAPLVDFSYEPFAQAEIARLNELKLDALETRIEADLRLGRHADLMGELERLLTAHPERERLAGQLMIAQYRCGRQADALDVFQRTRTAIAREPGAELKVLQADILAQTLEIPQPPSPPEPRHASATVPPTPTPTVGRTEELQALQALVADARLVTIVGTGGVGKTRLALELGRASPGCDFVPLGSVAAAEHVALTIAEALGVPLTPGIAPEDALARHLADHERVLILDNFEHVLDAAPLIAALLGAAPGLTVVATSREPLRIRGEQSFPLAPLDVSDGSELFLQTARARDYDPVPAEIPVIAAICERLDGLPLAIELMAGRLGVFSPRDLARRLDEGIDVVGRGPRDAPERQRTLRATLEWSHGLLEPEEQTAFAALAVFAGGATLDAALSVTGAPLEALEALLDKQLVVRANGRLGMLETVHAFARERLAEHGEADRIASRHGAHYLELAERAAAHVRRTASLEAAAPLASEIDNVRAALNWAVAHPDPDLALRLAVALDRYLALREPREGERWVEAALAVADERSSKRARAAALHRRSGHLGYHARWDESEAAAHESYSLFDELDDPICRTWPLHNLAFVRWRQFRFAEALEFTERALELARRSGDDVTLADCLIQVSFAVPGLAETISLAEEAAPIYSRIGNFASLALLQLNVAHQALCDGEYAIAEAALQRSRSAAVTAGSGGEHFHCYIDGEEGLLAVFTGDHRRAAAAFRAELHGGRRYGFDRVAYEALTGIAAVLAATDDTTSAAHMLGAADAFCAEHLDDAERLDPPIAKRLEPLLAAARARADAYAAGRRLDAAAAIALAGAPESGHFASADQ